ATPAALTWTIDTTAPDTTITANPPAPTGIPSASFGFLATEAGGTFECKHDGGAFALCASPQSYSALASGGTTVPVRAADGVDHVTLLESDIRHGLEHAEHERDGERQQRRHADHLGQ